MKVVVIDYGAGNTQSVKFALQRLGVEPVLSSSSEDIMNADKVIFPGVGHAKAAMEVLQQKQLDLLIPELKQPLLGICLGMQLLCAHSEEGDVPCLGVFHETVKLFPPQQKVPHMGWNQVTGNWLLPQSSSTYYYFVHSYYVPGNKYTTLSCDYILPFSAAMQKDNFYAVQFHPEKSGDAGEALLKQFISLP